MAMNLGKVGKIFDVGASLHTLQEISKMLRESIFAQLMTISRSLLLRDNRIYCA